jgi:hypothetical protein
MAIVELGTGLERRRQHDEKFYLTWILVKCRQCAALANVKKASFPTFLRLQMGTFAERRPAVMPRQVQWSRRLLAANGLRAAGKSARKPRKP